MRRAFVLISGVILLRGIATAQIKAASVCEILSDLERFSGKMVSLRAEVLSSVDTWLAAENCKLRIRVNGVAFDNLIAIVWPDSPIVQISRPRVPFPSDEISFDKLNAAMRARDIRRDQVHANVEGLIVTRHPAMALVPKSGLPRQLGFGHLNGAPAQIIVKTMSDFVISPRR
jgi:hypothetical protein